MYTAIEIVLFISIPTLVFYTLNNVTKDHSSVCYASNKIICSEYLHPDV